MCTKYIQQSPPPRGLAPWASASIMYLFLYILDLILMHIFDVRLMHTLGFLIRMHILDVLLLLATTVITTLFWELHHCNNGASAQECMGRPWGSLGASVTARAELAGFVKLFASRRFAFRCAFTFASPRFRFASLLFSLELVDKLF